MLLATHACVSFETTGNGFSLPAIDRQTDVEWLPPVTMMRCWVLLAWLCSVACATFTCDGGCSGNGACDGSTGRCVCFPGFIGNTCASRSCPEDIAWADYATAVDTAHAYSECSNMGTCDRVNGVCNCRSGFEGAACERMSCPSCINGRCVSMREAASIQDNTNFFVTTIYNLWDADKIYGCQCDNGFYGYDCSQRVCPKGDDPLTTGQVNEVQMLTCTCAAGCTGSFAFTFRRRTTVNLSPTSTAANLATALAALDTLDTVSVTLSAGTTLCDPTGVAVITTSITFTNMPGNLPQLQLQSLLSTGSTITVATTTDGTREEVTCSNHGTCDTSTGLCACQSGFASSDGAGGAGLRGDCGYGTTTTCPMHGGVVCNGKGTCDTTTPTYACTCVTGYTGFDCSQRTCPTGSAWFDGATAANVAHALAPCSNKGSCDVTTGLCTCNSLFTGSACTMLKCPGAITTCNGHGTCRTMAQLAAVSSSNGELLGVTYGSTLNNVATWDANTIQGCDCSINYYMGPYSGAVADFQAYDCSARFCPIGGDPYETGKVNEVQTLVCTGDSGTFALTFRQQTTRAIPFNSNAAMFKNLLEKLPTVQGVAVTIGSGTSVCAATAVSTFRSPFLFNWTLASSPISHTRII